jgi:hypothetical protein
MKTQLLSIEILNEKKSESEVQVPMEEKPESKILIELTKSFQQIISP